MTERSYEDAVQALKRRFGGRWDGLEADGRDEMADVLAGEMGYDRETADQVIDSLVRSGQLRYRRDGDDDGASGAPPGRAGQVDPTA